MSNIKFVFVSNYLNHHQIPFCNAMYELMQGSFVFIQTEAMEEERVRMGWNQQISKPYLKLYYQEPEKCKELIADARVVLFGGSDEESYIEARLEAGKPVVRYSERLYKTGQWKAVSPRGLRKKYHDHTRYRKAPVYLLCSGAYVASDFHIVRAYPRKMYCWGYFPETKHYEIEALLAEKGWKDQPYLLWAARMIDWKHPELPMETARYLKEKGLAFHMEIIGGGDMLEQLQAMRSQYGLETYVDLPGFMTPEQVRQHMEKADIFLFTSDRQEGWGAVANEAMNSGCALVANHMIGAVPYLVQHEKNGLIYRDGHKEQLFELAEQLVKDKELCRSLGRNAYETITKTWNAENAAVQLLKLLGELDILKTETKVTEEASGGKGAPAPCVPAPVVSERRAFRGEAWKIN